LFIFGCVVFGFLCTLLVTSIYLSLLFRLEPPPRYPKRIKKDQNADNIRKLQEIGSDDSLLPLQIRYFEGKGRGIVTTKKLFK
jgi:hypothetical protein